MKIGLKNNFKWYKISHLAKGAFMIESVWQFSNNKLEKSKIQLVKPRNESFNTLLKDQQSETTPFKTPPKNLKPKYFYPNIS